MDCIWIEGLEFYGYHGVPDAEQEVGHRYRVDLRLRVDTKQAGRSDHVVDTVDYSAVTACVLTIGAGNRFRLIETLAQHISDAVLIQFPRVQSVTVQVRKLLPPMNAMVAAVGIEIERARNAPADPR